MNKICAIIAAGLLVFGVTEEIFATPMQWTNGNGHYYEIINFSGTWGLANANSQTLSFNGFQGHLATITSSEENKFIVDNFTSSLNDIHDVWLGGFQYDKNAEPDGHWAWVTGEQWSFTYWETGEPNNQFGDEDHLEFHQGMLWNDLHNSDSLNYYMVEFEGASTVPEPSTFFLFLFFPAFRFLKTFKQRGKAQ